MEQRLVFAVVAVLVLGCSGSGLRRSDASGGAPGGQTEIPGTNGPPDGSTNMGGNEMSSESDSGGHHSTTGGSSILIGGSGSSGGAQSGGQPSSRSVGGATTVIGGQTGATPPDAGIDTAQDTRTNGTAGTTGNSVKFYEGRATGAMTGKGWARSGPGVKVMYPICKDSAPTAGAPCNSFDKWLTYDSLCVNATIPPHNASDAQPVGGLMVGVYASDPPGQGLGRSFQSMMVHIDGPYDRGLRILVHRKGDPEDVVYSAYHWGDYMTFQVTDFVRGLSPFDKSFPLSSADVPNLDWIGAYLESPTDSNNALGDLICLKEILFD